MKRRVTIRNPLVCALAGAVLVSAAWRARALPQDGLSQEGNSDEATSTPSGHGGTGDGIAAKKALFTVLVTGNDQPIAQAEVKVTFASGAATETTLFTDEKGEARFKLVAKGIAKVRVIADGWETKLQEVLLEEPGQHVMMTLTPLPPSN